MTYEKFINTVLLNKDEEKWIMHSCWGYGNGPSYLNRFTVWSTANNDSVGLDVDSHGNLAVLKEDLSISVAWGLEHNADFKEEWANDFPDRRASSYFVDFFYNGNLIYRDIYVSVDGGRANIPLPKRVINKQTYMVDNLYIERDRMEFYKIINGNSDEYQRYIHQAGIEIREEIWFH